MKAVWNEYDSKRMEIMNNAAKFANRQRLQGIFSMLGMCIGFIQGIDQTLRMVLVFAALCVGVYFS